MKAKSSSPKPVCLPYLAPYPILRLSDRDRIMPRAERDAATLESVRLFNEETRLLDMM